MNSFRSFLSILVLSIAIVLPKAHGTTPAPLPPLDMVIQRVMQTSADENTEYHIFNQHYFYTRDKVTEFFDASGKLKEREEKQTTNSPSPARGISMPSESASKAIPSGKQVSTEEQPNIHGVALGKRRIC